MYCVVDVETTGLDSTSNGIIELAASILDDKLEEKEKFHSFIKPWEGCVVDEKAMEFNKIPEDKYKNAPSESETIAKFSRKLKEFNNITFVSYNSHFPMAFLSSAFFRNKMHLPGDGDILELRMVSNKVINPKKYSLKSAAQECEATTNQTGAVGDVELMVKILRFSWNLM